MMTTETKPAYTLGVAAGDGDLATSDIAGVLLAALAGVLAMPATDAEARWARLNFYASVRRLVAGVNLEPEKWAVLESEMACDTGYVMTMALLRRQYKWDDPELGQ